VPFYFPWQLILITLAMVVVIALLAGWWPAQRAVSLQVIEAIGYE
jgi:ABC-type antimicrobial peptide transport system permease subunit